MKKVLALSSLLLGTLTMVGCTEPDTSYDNRMDKLYSECIAAGGSFFKHSGPEYSCILPGTEVK